MLRRKRAEGVVPAKLSPAALPPYKDDPDDPLDARKRAFNAWYETYVAWHGEREAWAERHGWPGGLASIDDDAPTVPDAPFDERDI